MTVPTPNSSTGGYLQQLPADAALPAPPQPITGQALLDLLQGMIVGVTGLDGTLVRPLWQPTPPQQPPATVNWAAFGIININPDAYPVVVHKPDVTYQPATPGDAQGVDRLQRHQQIDVRAVFYGPDCWTNASLLRDGVYIPQNRELLVANGMNLTGVSRILSIPELINTVWYRRCDITLTIAQEINREYAVLDLASAVGIIETGVYDVDFEA